MKRSGVNTTIAILVAILVFSAVGYALITVVGGSITDVFDQINPLVEGGGEAADCNVIRSKCSTQCSNACLSGGVAPNEIYIDHDDVTIDCYSNNCTRTWQCRCD